MKTEALYTTQLPDKLRDIALNRLATEGQKLALAQSENYALTRCISELEKALAGAVDVPAGQQPVRAGERMADLMAWWKERG